jgi:hypothetical protein
MHKTVAILAFLLVSDLSAQPLTVGTMPTSAPSSVSTVSTAPVSWINLADHATGDGTVNRATVFWSAACSGAFKIVFLTTNTLSTTSYIVRATRGPFNSVAGRNDVTLSPPVTVSRYDLIAVVQLQPFSVCGSPMVESRAGQSFELATNSDVSVSGSVGTSVVRGSGLVLAFVAYNSDPQLTRVLPAAGAVQGNGAFFRTSVQLNNQSGSPLTGKLVFHRAGVPATPSDPSLPFSLAPSQTLSYPDVVTTMGTSGLGSLDVLTNGAVPPIVTGRIFSDAGAAGTSGFTEEGLPPGDALQYIYSPIGILILPADLTNFRMNIGVRTLEAGATLSVAWYSADGTFQGVRNGIAYPANYFEQVSVNQFTGSPTLAAGGSLRIQMAAGSAFVYASTTDNRTQDSSMRIAATK